MRTTLHLVPAAEYPTYVTALNAVKVNLPATRRVETNLGNAHATKATKRVAG